LLGKQLDRFPCEEPEVLVFLERVTEAQRVAALGLREAGLSDKQAKGDTDAHDLEEITEELTAKKRKVPHKGPSKKGGGPSNKRGKTRG
jgi:hypothetical protein